MHDAWLGATAVTVTCSAFLAAALKRIFRSECIDGQEMRSSALRPTITSLLVASSLALGVTAACFSKTFFKRPRTSVAAVTSKWQPVFFIAVSFERVILKAVVIPYAAGSIIKRGHAWHLSATYSNQVHASTFLWDCVMFVMGMSTICVDLDSEAKPALRRSAQFLLAMCLCVDTFSSYVWGNYMASLVSLGVSTFEVQMDSVITSCITSQAMIALHFMYVGWRSRFGRGWHYAPLRFELNDGSRMSLTMTSLKRRSNSSEHEHANPSSLELQPAQTEEIASSSIECDVADVSDSDTFLSSVRKRLLFFQMRHLSKCRTFVIQCTNLGDTDFELKDPTFALKCLTPLQRMADAHPRVYTAFICCCLAAPSFACAMILKPESRGIVSSFLNLAIIVALLGFFSSRRFNIDKSCVKEVALSFRFGVYLVLMMQCLALTIRRAYSVMTQQQQSMYAETPWDVAALLLVFLGMTLILFLDCSPHFPASAQILVTVSAPDTQFTRHPTKSFTFPTGRVLDGIRVLGFRSAPSFTLW